MATYVAFLRAVNLGPNRKFPKQDICRVVTQAGFGDAETHINTGNVRLTTAMRSRERIEAALEKAFLADRGFEVPTIVFSAAEFAQIGQDAAELATEHPDLARHYVYLLKRELTPPEKAAAEATSSTAGDMVVRGRAVHALLGPGYQDGTVDPLGGAKLLGVATARNVNVISAMVQKWC